MLNHRTIAILSLLLGLNFLISTQTLASNNEKEAPAQQTERPLGIAKGSVISTMDASGYTYVEANMGDGTIWLAGPATALAKGESITVKLSKPMLNFHSKSLNQDFPVIYFISSFNGNAPAKTALPSGHQPINGSQAITPSKKATLDKPLKRTEGGKTISEIIAGMKELSGKKIKVRGQITKFNPQIMKRNWIHLIDGSGDSDLIITTNDTAKVGDIVVIEGTVVLDKDFSYGYFYKLLIEEAKVTVE